MEHVYFNVLLHWYRHRDYSPSLADLGRLFRPRKSIGAVRSAMLGLEGKGYVDRNAAGQFVVCK